MKATTFRPIQPLLAIAFVSLSGCTQFEVRPLRASDAAAALTARSLDDAGLRQFLASQKSPGGAWTVDRLALAAAYFHGAVRVARAEAEQAAAGVITAGQLPNPVLSFSPGYNSTSSGISPWIMAGAVDVKIETAGKRGKRVAVANAQAEAARLRTIAAAWDARVKVRAAMLDLHAAREMAELIKSEIALHEEALKKLGAQVEAGGASAFEVTQERLALNRARLALHDAEKQQAVARASLAAAVGVPEAALNGVALQFGAFASLPSTPGSQARRRALTHRSDLLALLADYAAADAALRLEVARQYPDVKLNPGYKLDQTDNEWALGLSVELPVLNRNRGPIKQAEAARNTASEKFAARQAEVSGEVEKALAAYRSALAKAATASTLADEAGKASETTGQMVKAGELTPLDLTRRRVEVEAAALSRLEARIQAHQALGALEAAIQTPLH